jgi:transposase
MDPLPPVDTRISQTPTVPNTSRASSVGVIEIEFGGARVRLRGAVDPASVRCVLQTL